MRLRARFAVAALLLAETALLSALVLQHRIGRAQLERQQRRAQEETLARLARVAKDATLQQNELYFLNYLRVLRDSPQVRYAAFIDEGGRARLHSGMLDGAGPPAPAEGISELSAPVSRGERLIGEVRVGFDIGTLRRSIEADLAELRRKLLWNGMLFSLVAVLGAAWLARTLTEPLSELIEGARRLGKGELGHRLAVARSDELGAVADEFNRMAEELDRLHRFKEQLLGSITHDLRSPLTAIEGHAQLLLADDSDPDERRQSARLIRENARRMAAMANDITDLVKLQSGRLQVSPQPVRIEQSLEAARLLLEVVAKPLGVSLDVELPAGLPEVRADPYHLQRVLTNLVSNALRFTPSGGRISLRAAAEAHHLKIVVADTGTGIPEAKLKTLFTRFIGTEGIKHSASDLGTGLGLSICRELVELHGGRIWAESELKKGTRMTFTLPLGGSACSGAC